MPSGSQLVSFLLPVVYLHVYIAQWCAVERSENLANQASICEAQHVQWIINSRVAGWRDVPHSNRAVEFPSFRRVKHLPNPEDIVEHGVMKEEGRIVWGGVEITSISPQSGMTRAVQTDEAVRVAT